MSLSRPPPCVLSQLEGLSPIRCQDSTLLGQAPFPTSTPYLEILLVYRAGASPISVSWGEGGDATLAGNAYIDAVKKGQIHDVSSEALAVDGEEWRIPESVLMKRKNGDDDDDDDDDDDSGIGCFHATRRRKRSKSQSGKERGESNKAGDQGMCIIGAREGRIIVSLGLRGGLEGGWGLGFLSFGDAGSRLVQWMGFMADHKVSVKL